MTTQTTEPRFKCHTCHVAIRESQFEHEDKRCPNCGEKFSHLDKMCELDHCNCTHEVQQGISFCPVCNRACCPVCGSHDVAQISRVTGYLQDVAGWNAAKAQELKDRKRTNI